MITDASIHRTQSPTDAKTRTHPRVYRKRNTHTKKSNQSRTSSRASRHVHHTLGVVLRVVLRTLLPRFILDVQLVGVGVGVRATDIRVVFVRSRSRSSLRARAHRIDDAHRETHRNAADGTNERGACALNWIWNSRARDRSRDICSHVRVARAVHAPRPPSSPAFGGSSVRSVVNSFVSLSFFYRRVGVETARRRRRSHSFIPTSASRPPADAARANAVDAARFDSPRPRGGREKRNARRPPAKRNETQEKKRAIDATHHTARRHGRRARPSATDERVRADEQRKGED